VLSIDWDKETRRSPGDGSRLAERLTRASATVSQRVLPVAQVITAIDRTIARSG